MVPESTGSSDFWPDSSSRSSNFAAVMTATAS
jgi:hypothetical protein